MSTTRLTGQARWAGRIGMRGAWSGRPRWRTPRGLVRSGRTPPTKWRACKSTSRRKISTDQEVSKRVGALAQRVSSEPLKAPVGGYIVNCTDRPENVIEPSTPLFDIFDPQRAYVLAYFDPRAMAKVPVGQPVEVMVAGLSPTLAGHVVRIYPTLVKLPEELTRFFWQHVQWSEYRPVRIALDGIDPQVREQLYYGAQTRVRVRIRRSWNPFAQ